jgi:hypothetical protein
MLIIALFALGSIGFSIYAFATYSGEGRNEDTFSEKSQQLKKFKFDEDSIARIRSLEGKDFEIKSNLNIDRTNPFGQ